MNNLEKAIESESRNGLKWNLSQDFGGDFGKLDYVAYLLLDRVAITVSRYLVDLPKGHI